MKTNKTSRAIKKFGLPIAAAGMLLLFAPHHSKASMLDEPLLMEGMNGTTIEELQEKLVEEGYLNEIQITGIYTEETAEAIAEFQESKHLHVDGISGPQTLGALAVLKRDDQGPLVESLQHALEELSYYVEDINGSFDKATEEALKAFQKDEQLTIDGIAGPETFSALYLSSYQPYSDKQKNKEAAREISQSDRKEQTSSAQEERTLQVEATAYTADCEGCSGITSTGIDLTANPNQKVVAVDPTVIPLGSKLYVEGYGEAIAGDTGGAIKGNKIDLLVSSKDEALNFGRKQVNVTIID